MRNSTLKACCVALLLSVWSSFDATAGYIVRQFYDGIDGQLVINLTTNAIFTPDAFNGNSEELTDFFEGTTGNPGVDTFGSFIRGYLEAPQTGDYIFWVASDDNSELWLSTDSTVANKKLIASVSGADQWTNAREYGKYVSQQSAKITLTLGQKYYVEVYHKEGTGGDNISVGWQLPDGTMQRPLPGYCLAPYFPANIALSIKTQPQSISLDEAQKVVFSVSADGAQPITYQWYRGSSPITGGTLSWYSIGSAKLSDNNSTFYVNVTRSGTTLKSDVVTLNVNQDMTPPQIVSAQTLGYPSLVQVSFSEPVTPATANSVASYAIDNGVTVTKAVLQADGTNVLLTTGAPIASGKTYTITANGVKDLATTPNASAGSVTFNQVGALTRKAYTGISGSAVSDLTGNSKYPNSPDSVSYLWTFENPTDWAFNYGILIQGYLIPPETGAYTFYVSSDNGGQLFLSTDDNPANLSATPIAFEITWTGGREYINATEATNQMSAPINLVAGKRYYVQALHKGDASGDNFAVTWKTPSGPDVVNGAEPIPGIYLAADRPAGTFAITAQPQSLTSLQARPATFTIAVDAFPTYTGIQWYRNGSPVPAGNGLTYTIPLVSTNDNGAVYYAVVSNLVYTATSSNAVLTVNADNVLPTVAKVVGSGTFDTVTVSFSEQVNIVAATNKSNYTISPALAISSATLDATRTNVVLITVTQTQGASYTIAIKNVQDLAGNVMTNTTKNFTGWVFATGVLKRETFWSITSMATTATTTAAPDLVDFITGTFETYDRAADNFTVRLTGILIAPETGDYQFYIATDDQGEVFISTDENPANLGATAVIHQGGWNSSPHNWLGDAFQWSADAGNGLPGNVPMAREIGSQVPLVKNSRYYIMALEQEGSGGDYLAVNWKKPSDTAEPASGTPSMSLSYFGTYVNPDGAVLNITQDLTNITAVQSFPVTFTIVATGTSDIGTNLVYQWKRANVDIAGANSASYTIAQAQASDNNVQFKCVVSLSGKTLESKTATLTVISDTVPPTLVSAFGMVSNLTVTVNFSERVDPATAANLANYTVNGTAPTVAVLSPGGKSVVLTVSALTGATANVLVSNIKDPAGNTMASGASTSAPLNSSLVASDIGTAGNPIDPGLTSAVGASDFDVRASGTDIWDTADGFHFVYEQKTGDFDVVVRVQRLDPMNNWSKAGLMARENLTPGSRDLNIVVDPAAVTTADGGTGANLYEANYRPLTGTNSMTWDNGGVRANAGVPYPNAWMRLKRAGNEFRGYRSYDGSNWIQIAQMQVIDSATNTAYPSKIYVGMATTSHNNVAGFSTVAEYRGYGNYVKPALPEVLLLIANATPNAADQAVISHLATKGYQVTAIPAPAALTADATGKALVIVSSTVSSGDVLAKYRDVAVPVLAWENGVYDDMGMTALDAAFHASTAGLTNVTIVNASHPMAAGLAAGAVTVTTIAETFTWGIPNSNAVIIANLPAGQAAIFGYETGAALYTGTAAARRVGFFLYDATFVSLTGDGVKLFDAAVAWAAGVVVAQQPKLTISKTANKVTIAWPQAGSTLQSTPKLPATWTDVTGSAATNKVEVPIGTANEFFRLKQ